MTTAAASATPTAPVASAVGPETAALLLARLAALDIRLALDGERLTLNAPKGALTPDLRAELGRHKAALIEHLRSAGPAGSSVSAKKAAGAEATPPQLVVVPRLPRMPVAHTQQRLWFLRQMNPGSSTYNVGLAFEMRGVLDVAALERSLAELVQRHESLRTFFVTQEGTPYCSVDDKACAPLRHLDLSGLAEAEREPSALHALQRNFETAFDLAQSPLLRLLLVRVAPERHLLGLVTDHIVADGISVGVFFFELQHLYRQHISRHAGTSAAPLPPLPVQYIDHVQWQRAVLAAGAQKTHLDYWKQQLRGLPPVLNLPTDRPRPRLQTQNGTRLMELWPTAFGAELKAFARQQGVTLYMVLLAGYQILLSRLSGETDFAVGTAVGARERPEIERVVGFFANNIVQRADVSANPTVRELLQRVRETALKAYAHQDMPFDVLVDALAPRRDLDHSPLFQVMFVLHTLMVVESRLGDMTCTPIDLPYSTARFDLTVDIFDRPEGLRTYFEFNTDLFDEASIRALMGQFRCLLKGMLADAEARVGDLPMIDAASTSQLLAQWRGPALAPPLPPLHTVHGLVEAQARRTPSAEAANFAGIGLSYAELDARANRLARHLQGLGIGTGKLVGVWMERSLDMVVSLLAVLKAGAAYVPLDPAFPRERVDFMMSDAALAAVLTTAALARTLPADAPPSVALDRDASLIAACAADAAETAEAPAAHAEPPLAYVIYTSGSTGRPKGVMIEHRAVVNFLRSMHAQPGIGASDRWLSVTTLSFDICGLELWGPLTAGGTVVLASRSTALDGVALAELMEDLQASILQATPATWRLLLETGWAGRRGLRMLCGGEALPRELAERLLALCAAQGGELWNMYGPTETTIWSTLKRINDASLPITIGRPIAETSIVVLEPSGRPAPVGVAGELCIGGAGVARGYLNRPDLTAEKFVDLALDGARAERWYRTGDLARLRHDGELEFIGRRDHQVKLRGFRIELGEIEVALAAHPGIRHNVVTVREDTPGDQRLVAYVVEEPGTAFDSDAARTALRARLPEYMVPNHFVVLDHLPLTPNAKVDRKALPAPQEPRSITPADEGSALMNAAQQRVATAWCELLGRTRVGLRDNFFDLGGHSLLLVKLQVRLQREFGVELPLLELFQRTTVQAQAERLSPTTTGSHEAAALQRAHTRSQRQTHA